MTHVDRMKEIEARMSAYKRTPSRSPLTNALVRDVDFLLARNAALEAALGEAIELLDLEMSVWPDHTDKSDIDHLTAIKEGMTYAD